MAYLPNRKIFFLLIFILLIFVGWFVFGGREKNSLLYIAKESGADKNALEVAARKTLAADSDNDGLQDWEEALWKTDPKNSDTDNDSTPDGEEVNVNRNPLKPGPDDKVSIISPTERLDNFEEVDDNSLTGLYAKEFLTDYLTLKNQKGTLSESDKSSLVDSLLEKISSTPVEIFDTYEIPNTYISADNTKTAIEKYASEVKKIFIEKSHIQENEIITFERLVNGAAEKNINDKDINKLNSTAEVYKKAADWLILISVVPGTLAKDHAAVINGLKNVSAAIRYMANIDNDPIKSASGLTIYSREIQRVYNAMQNLQGIFNGYGISVF